MNLIPGLSYGHITGSLAYPLPRYRPPTRRVCDRTARAVLELIHPGQFKALPPSPHEIAYRGDMMGVIQYEEVWK